MYLVKHLSFYSIILKLQRKIKIDFIEHQCFVNFRCFLSFFIEVKKKLKKISKNNLSNKKNIILKTPIRS